MFARFHRIHEHDGRQMDRQTPHDGLGRAYRIASRGKNSLVSTSLLSIPSQGRINHSAIYAMA